MEKRKVRAKDVLKDIKVGADDATLMTRHNLSAQALQSVFRKLVAAGMITQAELDDRVPLTDRTVDIGLFICPSCGNIQAAEFGECPRCGYSLPSYMRKSKEAETLVEPVGAGSRRKTQAPPTIAPITGKVPASVVAGTESLGTSDQADHAALSRIESYCRLLGVATVASSVLVVAAVLIFTQLALPGGAPSLAQSILAASALGIPVVLIAFVVLVTLRALSESIRVFLRIAGSRGNEYPQ
jgi:hypothetical protein